MPPFWQGCESQGPGREMPVNGPARRPTGANPAGHPAPLPGNHQETSCNTYNKVGKKVGCAEEGLGVGGKGHLMVSLVRPCVNDLLTWGHDNGAQLLWMELSDPPSPFLCRHPNPQYLCM